MTSLPDASLLSELAFFSNLAYSATSDDQTALKQNLNDYNQQLPADSGSWTLVTGGFYYKAINVVGFDMRLWDRDGKGLATLQGRRLGVSTAVRA